MFFSAYNSSGVRVLSNAYVDALSFAHAALKRKLNEGEETALNKTLARNLMDAHDSGERDPNALRRAALQGVFAWDTAN